MSTTNVPISDIYAAYKKGNLLEAENDCLNILVNSPANADAHHILGLVHLKKGDTAKALNHLSRAIELSPDKAQYHCSIGGLYHALSEYNDALKSYQKAIEIDPCLAEAHYFKGMILHGAGQLEAAITTYKNALKARPDYPEASCNLGAVFHALGQLDQAAACYRNALSSDPGNLQIEYNLACTYQANKRLKLAENHFLNILDSKPEFLAANFNLGLILNAQGETTDALSQFNRVITLKPDHVGALNNIGNIYMRQCKYASAIDAFERALSHDTDNPKIHFNIGACLKEDGQFTRAAGSFKKALKLDPDFAKAYAELCRCNQIICDWRSNTYTTETLIRITETCLQNGDESPVYPFDSLSLPFTSEELRKIATSHANTVSKNADADNRFVNNFKNNRGSRIRIGYVSQKFNNHAGAHLIAGLFGLHDRNKFEIFAYSIGHNDNSIYRRRIEQGCENFIDVSGQNFTSIAQRIYDDGINILIDLGIYNTHAMTEIFALRPAPVQVSYLGYPGTSGASFYDYILTDRTVTPPDQQMWFSEKFAYLPNCYQVNDHQLEIPEDVPDRSACQLPDSAFVFCSFNNSYKIEPVMFDVWMHILARVPDSVLWLLDHTRETTANLCREADSRGIDSKRLIFAEKLPKDLHLARHQHADLFLDTRVYNAHTTASDSLRVGVPVLTTPGTTFASRVAASLLNAVNLPEMIATDLEEYADIAVKYSTNEQFRQVLKETLSSNLESAPLFNTPMYARHLESAFRHMWDIYTSGNPARQFMVKPGN